MNSIGRNLIGRFLLFLRFVVFGASLLLLQASALTDANKTITNISPTSLKSKIEASLNKGCGFLLKTQNDDGSWGSARKTKGLNIFAPVPGSHRAFRLAVTALSMSALLEIKSEDANYSTCIKKGENYLLEKLPQLRSASPMSLYNVWSHCYGL